MKIQQLLLTIFVVIDSYAFVSFDQSMGRYYVPESLQKNMQTLQTLYKKNIFFNHSISSATEPRIPRIIHAIWLGSEPSEQILKNFASFQQLHPSWICILWRDEDLKKLKLQNQHLFDLSKNYGQRSDIARYELLYLFGGVYVDCDFFCIKSFDILHQQYDFYTGVLKIGKRCVGLANGLIASIPGHPILKQCIETMKIKPNEGKKKITKSTGPVHFTKSFFAALSLQPERCIVFPASFFYPAPNTKRFQTIKEMNRYIKPETFAIHYWTNSWKESAAHVKRSRLKWHWFI